MYYSTAPYYQAMVPFLIPDKKIFYKTIELKEATAKVKKSANKNTAKAIQERDKFEEKPFTS